VGTSKDLYGLLELPRGASREFVRKAHRRLVRAYHPDANLGDNSTEERFKEVQHAYEVLSDPRKRGEYDEVLRASSRGEDRSDLVQKLVDLSYTRHLNSWKACVSVLALFLIIDGFLFYRYEQLENTVPEPPTTAFKSQPIATSAEDGESRRAETQAEENDAHPDAIDHEQQDSPSYLRGTEPVATSMATEDLSPYPPSSAASANYPTPVIVEEGLTILPTSATAADYYYYSPDSPYEDGYYLPDPFYEDGYYLPDPLYEEEVGYE
jgi:curved DNA-binding protein CbpA